MSPGKTDIAFVSLPYSLLLLQMTDFKTAVSNERGTIIHEALMSLHVDPFAIT